MNKYYYFSDAEHPNPLPRVYAFPTPEIGFAIFLDGTISEVIWFEGEMQQLNPPGELISQAVAEQMIGKGTLHTALASEQWQAQFEKAKTATTCYLD